MVFLKKNNNEFWSILKSAEKELISWDSLHSINIYRIEYVAIFEDWSDGIEIYIFYKTEKEKIQVQEEGYIDKVKGHFIHLLKKYNYPFVQYPNVVFTLDSDENVKLNYEGSYFLRLR